VKRLTFEIGDDAYHSLKIMFPVYGTLTKRLRDAIEDIVAEEKLKDEIRRSDGQAD
jgi:hypothetical protein